jgi:hypothetical protein
MKLFYISLLYLFLPLCSKGQDNLIATYNNIIDGNISLQDLKEKRTILVRDSLGKSKRHQIISGKVTCTQGGYKTSYRFLKRMSKDKMKKFLKIYRPEMDIYYTEIKALDRKTKDTLILNDIHLAVNSSVNIKPKINYSSKIFPNHNQRALEFSELEQLDTIPTNGIFQIIHYSFSYVAFGIKHKIEVNSNVISQKVKEEFTNLYSGTRINFENIIIKDINNNIYQIPIKRFRLLK